MSFLNISKYGTCGEATRFFTYPQYGNKNIGQLLKQAGVGLALLPYKANGASKGVNSPFTNPWVDVANVVGKNLFDGVIGTVGTSFVSTTYNLSTFTFTNPTGGFEGQLAANVMPNVKFENGKRYTFSGISSEIDETKNLRIVVKYKDGSTGNIFVPSLVESPFIFTSALGKDIDFVTYSYTLTLGVTTLKNFQIEEGSVATTYEPYAKNNALLTNFAATTSDGWVDTLLPNGNTKPMLKFDGINSYGIFSSGNANINIINLDEFDISFAMLSPSTLSTGEILFDGLDGTLSTTQIGITHISDGSVLFRLGGSEYTILPIGSILPNTMNIIEIYRKTGRLICKLNNIEKYNQPNIISITTQSNLRLGARSSIANGTTHNTYSNIWCGGLLLTKNPDNWERLNSATKKSFEGYL